MANLDISRQASYDQLYCVNVLKSCAIERGETIPGAKERLDSSLKSEFGERNIQRSSLPHKADNLALGGLLVASPRGGAASLLSSAAFIRYVARGI
jgi:hypothetical protein